MDIRNPFRDLDDEPIAAARVGAHAAASAIPSPCTNVCSLDPASGWCVGCLRTIDEIAAWSRLDDAGKRAVWAHLPARRAEGERRGIAAAPRAASDDVEP